MLSILLALVVSASPFPGCPAQGDNPTARIQHLDLLKNRAVAPATINPAVTLTALMAGETWPDHTGATVKGYVVEVKRGGVESVNCHSKAHQDTHIEISPYPHPRHGHVMIVEYTPFVKAREGITTHSLEKYLGKCVKVSGWLFNDIEHKNAAFDTAPDNKHDWRQTTEEIHPVFGMTTCKENP